MNKKDISHHILEVISQEVFTNYSEKDKVDYGVALCKAFVIFIDSNLNTEKVI